MSLERVMRTPNEIRPGDRVLYSKQVWEVLRTQELSIGVVECRLSGSGKSQSVVFEGLVDCFVHPVESR